ncbi:MAG TPA: NeuD/PglB/VioB family sugar acetyltransferase [Solirubrobacteraceae bacterium]|nr:NeuD/PglB/VioB family sugar acetyltransferase [Solirubrobacteraceae bacterium]
MRGVGRDRRPRAAQRRRRRSLKPLLIIGSGGFARETLELVRAINRASASWRLLGVLDDDPRTHGRQVHGVDVIGSSAAVHDHPDALVAACVASPEDPLRRVALIERLALPPERYATLVHPAAVVPESATIGPGSVLHAGTVLTADVALGGHVAVMPAVVLTHDDVVEEGVTFGAGARVAGNVTIERGAYVGSGALVREGLRIGRGAVIGMGAVLTRDVPAGEVWAGVPARRFR